MDFRLAHLKCLPVVVALCAPSLSAVAQNGAPQVGQAILFSTPEGEGAASNATVFAAPDSKPRDFADQFQAPASFFNPASPEQFSLPSGGPANSGSRARRLQKMAEDQKDWALLTPEEILGVTPPEEILGNDAQEKERQSPTERFLARQQTVATNSYFNNDADLRGIFSKDKDNDNAADAARPGMPEAAQFFSRFGSALDNNPFAAQDQDNWFKPATPAIPKPDPEQVAAMERFRQMLNSGSSADAPEKSSKFLSSQQPLPDPNLEAQPVVNRFGASFAPLSSGIGKPTGLTPLPGIMQPVVAPVVTPSWAPQPPPWQSQNPQPFAVPQRKF